MTERPQRRTLPRIKYRFEITGFNNGRVTVARPIARLDLAPPERR
ncbi:hypothetical protein WDZ92_46920 [Nostoc sp. NIES-2111]